MSKLSTDIKKVNFDQTVKVRTIQSKPTINPNEESIDEDPEDIKDEDEVDINTDDNIPNTNADADLDEDNDTDTEFNADIYLLNLMSKFLDKYPHLDNYKNKKIIYELCKILVDQVPEQKSNQSFYLNLLESAIKDITVLKIDDLLD